MPSSVQEVMAMTRSRSFAFAAQFFGCLALALLLLGTWVVPEQLVLGDDGSGFGPVFNCATDCTSSKCNTSATCSLPCDESTICSTKCQCYNKSISGYDC